CTRVAIIHQGQLVTETAVSELLSSQGRYAVKLEQPQEALALVQQQPWGHDARLDEAGDLVVQAPGGRGRDLNLFLVNAGFVPESLSQATQDLEQVFLQLTGSSAGEIQ
ncbi:MAG TPA: hypothetical protein VH593_29725, partial [Ktedonobacteraceae bacterium]